MGKIMKTRQFVLIILFYNIIFLAISYKGLENYLLLEHLKREAEADKLEARQRMESAIIGIDYNLVGKIILGCIVVGLVFYGVNAANSTFQDSILVKGYLAGNRYLVSILDHYTGGEVKATTPPDQSVSLEVPSVPIVITLPEPIVSQETIIDRYIPHIITPEQNLEYTGIQEMSTVGDHLTQLVLW